jgi:hypothetical protein
MLYEPDHVNGRTCAEKSAEQEDDASTIETIYKWKQLESLLEEEEVQWCMVVGQFT